MGCYYIVLKEYTVVETPLYSPYMYECMEKNAQDPIAIVKAPTLQLSGQTTAQLRG